MRAQPKLEDKDFEQLKKQIRETPVTVDLVERTMQRYETIYRRKSGGLRTSGRRKAILTVICAVMVFTFVLGTGFISPTLAASLKQLPGMSTLFRFAGDLGLKTADEKGMLATPGLSDTHEGLTLNIPVVMFDGTRVSIGIERKTSEKKFAGVNLQGLIETLTLSINGEPINSFAPANTSNTIDPYTVKGDNDNSAIVQFSDLRNQGGKSFPDKFELTMNMSLLGIHEPFEINLPVEKNTSDNLILMPSISRTYGDIDLNLQKVEFTPITTIISTRIYLPVDSSLPNLGYDIFDDKGKKLNLITGHGWNPTDGNELMTDTLFEPFLSIPKSITIKPYKYVYKDEDKSEFKLNQNGELLIEYISELEITLFTK